MNASDRQGLAATYIARIHGQTEQVPATLMPDKLSAIGSCQAR